MNKDAYFKRSPPINVSGYINDPAFDRSYADSSFVGTYNDGVLEMVEEELP